MKVLTVVGTRPELIRLSLILGSFDRFGLEHVLVHTGQNYDERLSRIFFDELALPEPDVNLGVRAEHAGAQIAQIIDGCERVMLKHDPDALLVLGDTNSGLSAIAAMRHRIPIFHMEAGNRCFDRRVPEERNRALIDHISDWLLPYTVGAGENLLSEGISEDRVFCCGNPITDVLEHYRPLWEPGEILGRLDLEPGGYLLATVHRQETVDVVRRLSAICEGLSRTARELSLPVIWSVHPRTRGRLAQAGLATDQSVVLHEPFSFGEFVALEAGARCVITDSGTVQEECSLLAVPTVTCRESTERPETLRCGSNMLCGVEDPVRMVETVATMTASGRDWVSPYADDRGVAEAVLEFVRSHAGEE
jgi:UDP-N-acetylglucosamine 2-epimerase (non-hydrolysing)